MDPVFGTPIAHWTSFKAAPRLADSACLQRPCGYFFKFFYCPVFGFCASAPADPGRKIANPQTPGPFFWVVLGGGKGPRLLRGVPACGTPPHVRFLVSCGACVEVEPKKTPAQLQRGHIANIFQNQGAREFDGPAGKYAFRRTRRAAGCRRSRISTELLWAQVALFDFRRRQRRRPRRQRRHYTGEPSLVEHSKVAQRNSCVRDQNL